MAELLPYERTGDGVSPRWIWQGVLDKEVLVLPRFEASRDRLFSRFRLEGIGPPGGTSATAGGAVRWVDGVAGLPARDFDFPSPRGIKGIQCIVDLEDAISLGISHAAHNVSLPDLVDRGGAEPAARADVDGTRVPIAMDAVRRLDAVVERLTAAGVRVTAILLNPVPRAADPHNVWIHPATELANAPNGLGAFNLDTEAGYVQYRGVLEFLAERYTQPGAPHGSIQNFIIGNEIQAHSAWYNLGRAPPEVVVAEYQKACRVAALALAKHHRRARVFVSMDHHWAIAPGPDATSSLPGRAFLEAFQALAKAEGDFAWGVAFHPYPADLFNPRSWLDREVDLTLETKRITFKNVEVLPAYLAQSSFLYDGRPRPILLSEQGFHGPPGRESEELQAAAFAWAFERIKKTPGIEAFILHRHVDHPNEGGLRLGLWTAPPLAAGARAKPLRDVFAQAGAAEGWGPSLDFALPIIGQRSWREAFPRGVWRRASASSSADGFAPQGAVDGERFSVDRGLAWKGGAGATSWEWTGEFPEPRRVGSILAVLGDEAQTLRNWPCDYVWDWSPDGSTWHELEETRVSRERRMFRLQRLREPRTALAIRLRIRAACGESPVVREIETYPETSSAVEFPEWLCVVATDEKPNLGDCGSFLRLVESAEPGLRVHAQRVWIDAVDEPFVEAEPRPLCLFLTGNYADWCQRSHEPWRGVGRVAAAGRTPIWASCGGAQGLAILSENGVDSPWDCPHCRVPGDAKTPIYGHIGHPDPTARRACGDYSTCFREQGPTKVRPLLADPVLEGLSAEFPMVESHCGQIEWAPRGWLLIVTGGEGAKTRVQCIRRAESPVYAAQFHVELEGSPEPSLRITRSFLALARAWRRGEFGNTGLPAPGPLPEKGAKTRPAEPRGSR